MVRGPNEDNVLFVMKKSLKNGMKIDYERAIKTTDGEKKSTESR